MGLALSVEEWIEQNAIFCNRLTAHISESACQANQLASNSKGGDFRCEGCQGLHYQSAAPSLFIVSKGEHEPEKMEAAPVSETSKPAGEPAPAETVALSQDDLTGLDNLLLDLDDETLAFLTNGNSDFCRELQTLLIDPDEAPVQIQKAVIRTARTEKKRRYAVFMGRCRNCGGYMIPARERHGNVKDDEVYRCVSCGWRTSPVYEFNRGNKEATKDA